MESVRQRSLGAAGVRPDRRLGTLAVRAANTHLNARMADLSSVPPLYVLLLSLLVVTLVARRVRFLRTAVAVGTWALLAGLL